MTKGKIDKINAWPPGTWLDLSHGMKSQTRNAANGVTFGAVVRPQETELSQIFETRVLGIEAGLTPPPPTTTTSAWTSYSTLGSLGGDRGAPLLVNQLCVIRKRSDLGVKALYAPDRVLRKETGTVPGTVPCTTRRWYAAD